MKKHLLALAVTALLAVPASALGSTPPSHSASATCKALLASGTAADFHALGYKTLGDCISQQSKKTAAQRQALLNAEKTCRAAQTADPAAFESKYGTTTKSGKTGSQEDAFGKCVSQQTSAH